MTQTSPTTSDAPKAAFAIEGAVVQTPARIVWGLGAGDLALGGLGVLTLLLAALGAPAAVILVLLLVVVVLLVL